MYTQIHTQKHIHIHRAGQHTKTETGDTEELNSEGNEKRRRQRESRVNSGVGKKKSSDKHWHTEKAMHMFGMIDEQRQ